MFAMCSLTGLFELGVSAVRFGPHTGMSDEPCAATCCPVPVRMARTRPFGKAPPALRASDAEAEAMYDELVEMMYRHSR